MNFEEIVRMYQEGKGRQEAAMRKFKAAMDELNAANESMDSSMGLLEAYLVNLGVDSLLNRIGDNNMPRFMKSMFTMDFDKLF